MAEHIVCITAAGGIPLLSRTKPGSPPLSFPVVGSLYGVNMFGLNRDVALKSMITEDHWIVWKTYHDSIVLIAIGPSSDRRIKNQTIANEKSTDAAINFEAASHNSASTVTDDHYFRILDNVFNSMVLLTGLSELQNIENVDRLKKDLKSCHGLIDTFLDVDGSRKRNKKLILFGHVTHCVDVTINMEAIVLEDHLQAFLEASNSQYGCLVVDGKLLCATDKWRLLDGQELALLGRLICILPPSITSCDIPVYLPQVSPNVAHRLLIFSLVVGKGGGTRACALCGPEPSLTHIQNNLIDKFWGPAANTLMKCSRSNDIPDSIKSRLPSDMLGFLLVDTDTRGCVSYLSPPSSQDTINRRKHQKQSTLYDQDWIYDKLVDFYNFTVGVSFLRPESFEDDETELPSHIGISHYRCLTQHKCFGLVKSKYQLFVVYTKLTPTYALHGLTEKIFEALTKDHLI